MEETGRDVFTLVTEITSWPRHLRESSRHTAFTCSSNALYPVRVGETRVISGLYIATALETLLYAYRVFSSSLLWSV